MFIRGYHLLLAHYLTGENVVIVFLFSVTFYAILDLSLSEDIKSGIILGPVPIARVLQLKELIVFSPPFILEVVF